MKLAPLLSRYGYWVVLAGAFVEGETIVVMGGFATHHSRMTVLGVIACAFVGSLAGDQLAFFVGRRFGDRILAWRPKWRPAVGRARREIDRRGTLLLVSFRFFYGLRNAVPFVAGLAGVSPKRFAPLNALGAAIWAPTITLLGYAFGSAFERVLSHARHYQAVALAAIAGVGFVLFLVHKLWPKSRKAVPPLPDP